MKKNFKNNNGYTLIELMLYISLAVGMLLVISIALSTFFDSRIKNQTILEVDQEGMQVMQIITQTIRNANSVNFPIFGTNDTSLSLSVINPALDPTVFALLGNEINIAEGLNPAVSLTNNLRVIASGLLFENLSRNLTPNTIGISFTLSHINPSGRNEYNYSRTFYGSASLRH
ncbi:MAG: hypothetical protein WC264_02190 [Candidatus Paceibacterota bacterium]|jgi:type II secretory pathway pseudopilin PulG